jgi:hypothetical protein
MGFPCESAKNDVVALEWLKIAKNARKIRNVGPSASQANESNKIIRAAPSSDLDETRCLPNRSLFLLRLQKTGDTLHELSSRKCLLRLVR